MCVCVRGKRRWQCEVDGWNEKYKSEGKCVCMYVCVRGDGEGRFGHM